MLDILHTYILGKINRKTPLSETTLEKLSAAFAPKKLRKKQYLLQEGEHSRVHSFVCKGCLRMFRVDEKGQEHIIQFAIENWWIGDRESLISGQPSKYNIEALEDCELLMISPADLDILTEAVPEMKQTIQVVQQNNVIATQNRIHVAISYTAEEKYHNFLKTHPDIFQRVPQQMIASYLGITRETLSRIRKQDSVGKTGRP